MSRVVLALYFCRTSLLLFFLFVFPSVTFSTKIFEGLRRECLFQILLACEWISLCIDSLQQEIAQYNYQHSEEMTSVAT